MHAFARRLHQSHGAAQKSTKGLILNQGWRYDLSIWLMDIFMFRGQMRAFQQRAVNLARLQLGERALDVGCGTGALALATQKRVGATGHVAGIDPGDQQIVRARGKAKRSHAPIDFQIGVIEQIPFPDQTFDVVFSTLMMHHLPAPLKRQGLAEIARVLTPGGRLIIGDFTRKQERQGQAARFHAGGSNLHDLVALAQEAGFTDIATEEMVPRNAAFPGAGFVIAFKP